MSKDSSKKIIVTGGAKGIGKAITEKLLKEGFSVHIFGRDEKSMKDFISNLPKGSDVSYSVIDISNRDAVLELCNSWEDELYGIINNAGICKTERLAEELDVWDDVLNTNLNGLYFLTKGLLRNLTDGGRIINISSQLGTEGRAGYSAYCASKFGVIGLTKCWAKELGERAITVNAICPGWVKTDMAIKDLERIAKEKGISKEDFYKEICNPLELKRFTEPHEVASLVSFLVSLEAGGVTGRDWLLNTVWNQE